MSAEKLTAATTSYSIQYADPPPQTHSSTSPNASRDRERLHLIEALNDDQIWQTSQSRSNIAEPPYVLPPPRPIVSRPRTPRGRPTLSSLRYIFNDNDETATATQSTSYLDNCDWPALDSASSSGLTRAPTPPPFTIAAESEDDGDAESSYGGYLPSSFRHDLSAARDHRSAREHSVDSEDHSEDPLARRIFMLENFGAVRRPARRRSPGRIDLQRPPDDEVLQPTEWFFMVDSKITIKFDPPVYVSNPKFYEPESFIKLDI